MELVSWPMIMILLGAGIGVGFVSGLLGIAGGVILVPVLLTVGKVLGASPDTAVKTAFGTSLLVGFLTSLAGTLQHHRVYNICWRDAMVLAAAGIVGALIGSSVSASMPAAVLKPAFGTVVMAVAALLAFRPEPKEYIIRETRSLASLLPVGVLVGILSSLVGIGGGVMLVPYLTMALGYVPSMAVGTSGAVIPMIALFGATGYVLHGWGGQDLLPYSVGYVNYFFV